MDRIQKDCVRNQETIKNFPYRYDCKRVINSQIDKRTAADYYIKGSPFFIDGERICLLS